MSICVTFYVSAILSVDGATFVLIHSGTRYCSNEHGVCPVHLNSQP